MQVAQTRLALVIVLSVVLGCDRDNFTSQRDRAENSALAGAAQEDKKMATQELGMPQGKRVGPPDVPPVTIGGVRYEAIHWGRERGLEQNGGYIAAIDTKSGKELWILKIYQIDYIPKLETDVQDIFIDSMKAGANGQSLEIVDEKGRRYTVNLKTKKVSSQ